MARLTAAQTAALQRKASKEAKDEPKKRGAKHRVAPVNLSAHDREIAPKETVEITTTGDAEIIRQPIEVIQPQQMHGIVEDEKFMDEMVTVIVNKKEKGAALFEQVGHNGTPQYFQRGIPQKIKRRFLYSLMQSRSRQGDCSFGHNNGHEYNRLEFVEQTTLDFRVLNHGSEKGAQWYEREMSRLQ